jgi:hypothetical protein
LLEKESAVVAESIAVYQHYLSVKLKVAKLGMARK